MKNLTPGPAGQESLLSTLPKFNCPFKSSRHVDKFKEKQSRMIKDGFNDFKHFLDPEFNKYEGFGNEHERTRSSSASSNNLYNVNNDSKRENAPKKVDKEKEKSSVDMLEKKENSAIEDAIRRLAFIVGELEFQMGVESILAGDFTEAVNHFNLSTSHKHPGGTFNLALCYEQGFGVKKSMKTAIQLYVIASELGHAKASYNLGVFHAQGLGGVHKNFHRAKKYFEQAAELGCCDAAEALSLLFPSQYKFSLIEEFPVKEFYYNEKSQMPSTVSPMPNHNIMRRITVS